VLLGEVSLGSRGVMFATKIDNPGIQEKERYAGKRQILEASCNGEVQARIIRRKGREDRRILGEGSLAR